MSAVAGVNTWAGTRLPMDAARELQEARNPAGSWG
jgi:hypothetical protein